MNKSVASDVQRLQKEVNSYLSGLQSADALLAWLTDPPGVEVRFLSPPLKRMYTGIRIAVIDHVEGRCDAKWLKEIFCREIATCHLSMNEMIDEIVEFRYSECEPVSGVFDCVASLAVALENAHGGMQVLKKAWAMTVEEFITNIAGPNGIRFRYEDQQ